MNEIVDYYNKLAKNYDKSRFENTYGEFIDRQERKLLNNLLKNKQEIILDLACGSGRLSNYANFGVDASKEMIQIAQQKFADKLFFISDAEKTNLEDNSIDTIISFHFFMHLNQDKIHNILVECDRILKKNGRVIFDIPSAKRRKLSKHKSDDWHAGFSLTTKEIAMLNDNFELKRSFGLLFLPIHRFPKKIRSIFIQLDTFLANSLLKEYSSYQVIEIVKK